MKPSQFLLIDNKGNKATGEAYIIKENDKLNNHTFLEHVEYDFSNLINKTELVFVPEDLDEEPYYLAIDEVEVNPDNEIVYFKTNRDEYTLEVVQ